MKKDNPKIKILDKLSFEDYSSLEKVNKCYPGVPVVATSTGWVLFRSLEDFYNWFNSSHSDYQL